MKISVVNLGCKVNQYECDALVSLFEGKGFEVSEGFLAADLYVINTCAVTVEAERKSRQAVARCLKRNPAAEVFVIGCAAEANPAQFEEKPNVKYVGGTANKFKTECESLKIAPKTGRRRAYVKIQDGCDYFCSYCLVPHVRGRSRSREISDIVTECENLVSPTASGTPPYPKGEFPKVVLTGINISDFKPSLAELILALKDVPAKFSLGSLEVGVIDQNLMDALKNLRSFEPSFHLSLQSGDDKVLADMNRKYTREEFAKSVKLIRKNFENAEITTDIIVGYPTEDEAAFLNTLSLAKEINFKKAHIFEYSKRPGTIAATLDNVTPGDIIKSRIKMLEEAVNVR